MVPGVNPAFGNESSAGLPDGPGTAKTGPMAKISTHVLDTRSGKPAQGVRVRLLKDGERVTETTTNADGRCDGPLIEDPPAGIYELVFHVGDYFRGIGVESPFLDEVPVRFTIAAGENYHVPLVVTPWSYSTYRGS